MVAARLGCGALLTSDRPPCGRRGEGRRGREGYKLNRWRRRTIDGRAEEEKIRKKATQELHKLQSFMCRLKLCLLTLTAAEDLSFVCHMSVENRYSSTL